MKSPWVIFLEPLTFPFPSSIKLMSGNEFFHSLVDPSRPKQTAGVFLCHEHFPLIDLINCLSGSPINTRIQLRNRALVVSIKKEMTC